MGDRKDRPYDYFLPDFAAALAAAAAGGGAGAGTGSGSM